MTTEAALPLPRFAAIILAAGASRRMGQPKQLLPVQGQPLLLRAVDATLAAGAWPVIVVLGAHAPQIRSVLALRPVLIADNAGWAEGMASSLRAGLTTLTQFSRSIPGAVFVLCDQPALSAAALRALLTAHVRSGRSIAAARYDGHLGAPVWFAREHFPDLARLTGEAGARHVLHALPAETITAVDLPELAHDLDTPDDYAALPNDAP